MAERLSEAIKRFRSEHPELIGAKDCVRASYQFSRFCWDEYDFGENEIFYEGYWHFPRDSDGLHVVNIFGDTVIDWTARQFPSMSNAPVPLVYKLDERNEFFDGIPTRDKNGDLIVR